MRVIFLLLIVVSVARAGGDSLLCQHADRLNEVRTFRCTITRVQSYNGALERARGRVFFDRARGFCYAYTSPFTFTFLLTDSSLVAFDPSLRKGYRGSRAAVSAMFLRDLHTLGWLLEPGPCARYRMAGSIDSTVIYNGAVDGAGLTEYVAIDRDRQVVRAIEWFHDSIMVRQCLFNYRAGQFFPSSIVIGKPFAGAALRDSIIVSDIKVNGRIPPDQFEIADGVSWSGLPEAARREAW